MAELGGALAAIRRLVFPPAHLAQTINHFLVQPPLSERRFAPRQEFEIALTVRTSSGQTYRGFCRNMSATGLAALVEGELRIGEPVEVTLRLADRASQTTIPFTVRHRTGFRYGMEFCAEAGLPHPQLQSLCDSVTDAIAVLRAELMVAGLRRTM